MFPRSAIRARAGFAIGHALGLLASFGWLGVVLRGAPRVGAVGAWAMLLLASISLAVARLVACDVASTIGRRVTGAWGVLVAGTLLAAVDLLTAWMTLWYHTISALFVIAEFPGIDLLLSAVGFELATIFVFIAAFAASRRPATMLAVIATGVLIVFAHSRCSSFESAGQVEFEGIQPGAALVQVPSPEQRLAWLERGGTRVEGSIVVWPEGAYPYDEHIGPGWRPKHLLLPLSHTLIFGMHGRLGRPPGWSVAQVAVAVPAGSEHAMYRLKADLPPFFERGRIQAGQDNRPLALPHGPTLLPICYEILNRSAFATTDAILVISVSADLSFDSSGSASMLLTKTAWLRAQEFGLPTARISDGSYSAAYGHDGRLLGALGDGSGTLRVSMKLPRAPRRVAWARYLAAGVVALALMVASVRRLVRIRPAPYRTPREQSSR